MDPALKEKRLSILSLLKRKVVDEQADGYAEAFDELITLERQVGEVIAPEVAGERKCRLCGCTDLHGCPEGCSWVEEDLCSSCDHFLTVAGRLAERNEM